MKILQITLAVFLLFSCTEKYEEETIRNVKGTAAFLKEISDETNGFGSLSFLTKLDITSPVDGIIKKINRREGSDVVRGETVILLENPQIVLALERAENNFSQAKAASELARSRLLEGEFQAEAQLLAIEKAEAELTLIKSKWEEDKRKHQNLEALFEAGGISQETVISGRFNLESDWNQILILKKEIEIRKIGCRDQDLIAAGLTVPLNENEKRKALVALMTATIKSELNAALARLDAAGQELKSAYIVYEDMTIKSQSSGIVGARYYEEGERVQAGEKILTLMDTSSLYALIQVREKDAMRIDKGMSAVVMIDGIGDERQGIVDLVYPQADSQSLSFMVRVLITGSVSELKPGMFARVRVILGSPRNGVFLPSSSLVGKNNNEADVFLISGNHLSGRKVILGQALGDHWEIQSGIKAGEIVVLRPDSDMKEGTLVALSDI